MKQTMLFLLLFSSILMAKPEVTVGLPAIAYLAKAIGGDQLKVTILVSSKQDPHGFASTPSLMQSIKKSQLFFSCNLKFERVICDRLSSTFKTLKFINLSQTIPAEKVAEDPHIWLSIVNLSKMAAVIKNELIKSFPKQANIFNKNYKSLSIHLKKTHAEFSAKLKNHKGDTFFVHHPAFGYFAHDYGLRQYAIENEGKNPSPKQLLRLIQLAKKEEVKLILVQPQFNQKPAKMLASRIKGEVFGVNPMNPDPVALLRKVVNAIEKYYPVK